MRQEGAAVGEHGRLDFITVAIGARAPKRLAHSAAQVVRVTIGRAVVANPVHIEDVQTPGVVTPENAGQ